MGRLSDMTASERPRERLLASGPVELGDDELLALVFGTGRGQHEDALELADRVIKAVGGLGGLSITTAERLQRIVGVGPVKATRLLAAMTLSARIAAAPAPEPLDDDGLVERMRGQVPTGETALLAVDDEDPVAAPVTVSLGDGLGGQIRPGSVLSRLLSAGEAASWSLVFVRPGNKVTKAEQAAGVRLLAAAEVVGVAIERLLVVGRTEHWRIRTGES